MANYPEKYWQKKTFAPSCLIYFIGLTEKINSLNHHTLFFDEDLSATFERNLQISSMADKAAFLCELHFLLR